MATGCYLPRTTVCPDLNMARPPAEICRLIETSLRHLHISAYGHAIESSIKSFYNYRTMTCFPLLHAIQSGLPLRIFFCKGSVGITKRQTGNGKSSSNGVERICCSLICLIACQHAGKAKISLGQAGKLETKGKKIQSVWHRLTRTSKTVGQASDLVLQVFP